MQEIHIPCLHSSFATQPYLIYHPINHSLYHLNSTVNEMRSNDELSKYLGLKKKELKSNKHQSLPMTKPTLNFSCPTHMSSRKNHGCKVYPISKKKNILLFSQEQSGRSCCGLTIQVGDEAKAGFVGIIDPSPAKEVPPPLWKCRNQKMGRGILEKGAGVKQKKWRRRKQ